MRITKEDELKEDKSPKEEDVTHIDLGNGPKKPGRPKKQAFTITFVQNVFFYLFVLLDKVFHSDAEFKLEEFQVMAGTWLMLQERFPWMSIALNILAPVMVLGQAIHFAQRIRDGRAKYLEKRQREQAIREAQQAREVS
jgi:hypothetical protein